MSLRTPNLSSPSDRISVPFFYKLLAAFLVVVSLPVMGLTLYSFLVERQIATQEEVSNLQASTARFADEIDKYILANRNLSQHLALARELKEFARTDRRDAAQQQVVDRWLRAQTSVSADYSVIYLLDPEGTCIASSEPSFIGKNYAMRSYFKEAKHRRTYKSDWAIGLTSREPGIYLSSPVLDGAELLGVAVLKLRVDRIQNTVAIWKQNEKDAFLINRDGVILAHTRSELVYHSLTELSAQERAAIDAEKQFAGRPIPSLNIPEFKQGFQRALTQHQPEAVHYRLGQAPKLAVLVPLQEQEWVAGIALAEVSLYGRSNLALRRTLLFSGFSLVVAVAIGLVMSRRIAGPLQRLNEAVNNFGAGRTYVRAEARGNDEVSRLAASFNRMATAIGEHTDNLEAVVRDRTQELERLNQDLKHLSQRDALTDCFNRRYFDEHFDRELARSRRYGLSLSMVLCDLDHFKLINDTHGHPAGDAVLRDFARIVNSSIRRGVDWVVRYGGEEFVVVLPETGASGAATVAERLRRNTSAARMLADHPDVTVTASFGVASHKFVTSGSPGDANIASRDIIAAADDALYEAKDSGRNKVVSREI